MFGILWKIAIVGRIQRKLDELQPLRSPYSLPLMFAVSPGVEVEARHQARDQDC